MNRYVLFFSLAVAGCLLDLISKSLVFARYFDPTAELDPHRAQQEIFGNWFGIQTHTNGGALFGFGQGQHLWFASLAVVALVGVLVWLFIFKAARDKFLVFSLGLISGGIVGNLYDRLGLGFTPGHPEHIKYHVRDWIFFHLDGVPGFDPWPNFNIADSLLVVGAGLLFFQAMFLQPRKQPRASHPAQDVNTPESPASGSEQTTSDGSRADRGHNLDHRRPGNRVANSRA